MGVVESPFQVPYVERVPETGFRNGNRVPYNSFREPPWTSPSFWIPPGRMTNPPALRRLSGLKDPKLRNSAAPLREAENPGETTSQDLP